MYSQIWKLSKPCPLGVYRGFFTQAWIKSLSIDSAFIPSTLPGSQGGGNESSNQMIVSPGNQPPSSGVVQKEPHHRNKRHTKTSLLFSSLRKFRGFGVLWTNNLGQRPNIYEKYSGHLNAQVNISYKPPQCSIKKKNSHFFKRHKWRDIKSKKKKDIKNWPLYLHRMKVR